MRKNNFVEGALIATIAIIITKVMGVLYVIPFYKIIGDQGGALYGYAYNIYNIFLIISTAGIPLAISKLTSEYETKKETSKKIAMYHIAKKIILIFSITSFVICFFLSKPIAILILGDLTGGNSINDVSLVIKAVSFALLIVPTLSISRGYLQGHKYISSSSFSQVIEQLVRIIVILLGSFFAIKVLKIPVSYAVAISVTSAFFGALISYIYLKIKLRKSNLNLKTDDKLTSKKDKKEIIQKIIGYSLPFIIINVANSLYNSTDMILMIKVLNNLGYPANEIEEISAIFTTWGSKLLAIVKAFATGLTISLIPSLVSAFISKDDNKVNYFFNKALQILLYVIVPITIFMSIFASEIWYLFYGKSYYGPIIFKFNILVAILDSANILVASSLQGLYKNKLIYIATLSGLLLNIILDVPLMYLCNNLNIYPFYGAIIATIIGYSISIGLPLIVLHKKDNFKYKSTLVTIPKLLLSLLIFVIVCFIYKKFILINFSYISTILYLAGIGLISFGIYICLNYKMLITILKDKLPSK